MQICATSWSYVAVSGSCYYMSQNFSTWSNALKACHSLWGTVNATSQPVVNDQPTLTAFETNAELYAYDDIYWYNFNNMWVGGTCNICTQSSAY